MSLTRFIKHTMAFSTCPEIAMLNFRKRYGDPFPLQLVPSKSMWVSGTAAAAKSMFSAKPETFRDLESSDPFKILVGSNSLIVAAGKRHLYQKRAMLPHFDADHIKPLFDMMRSCVFSEIKTWQSGEKINISAAMENITLNIIITAIFGIDDPQKISFFRKRMRALLQRYTPPLMFVPVLRNRFWSPWRKFVSAREKLDQLLLQEIKMVRQTEQAKNNNNILSRLATLTLSNGQQWTPAELCDQLKTLMVGGHDTLSSALGWTIFYVYSHPEVQEKLLVELESSNNLSIDNIVKLPYLDAVCKEALRHHPAVPTVIRTLDKPLEFANKHLPAGSSICLSITLLHSDPRVWENPTEFDPDRFLRQKFSNYEYAPFGGGIKKCLGMHFAMYQIKLILATMLLNCQFSNLPTKAPPTRIYGLTMSPKKPIFATVDFLEKERRRVL